MPKWEEATTVALFYSRDAAFLRCISSSQDSGQVNIQYTVLYIVIYIYVYMCVCAVLFRLMRITCKIMQAYLRLQADVFAEPGLELQQLAQKRRSMTKALRKRLTLGL